jgi:hypothetical protein
MLAADERWHPIRHAPRRPGLDRFPFKVVNHRHGLPCMTLDLTEEETGALASLLSRTIGDDRYPLSPRIQILKGILAKIRPEPAREPLPPPKVYAPPRAKGRRRG